ncbi:MAG: transposase [Nitrososphaerota archaeon]|jgi:transposase|nr:transposase [Nitrososphaerota archaeon]MDG6932943.1 transposase [Nitrososphaerota archaeon]MDG6935754.1 transposase [Nitrososphaerota archaeon]MDG6944158.1 transposase [Nitrososphaerota archaeon]
MEDWVREMAAELKKRYGPVEVKRNGSNYYLYRVSSVYDREKGRARKVSGQYLGKLTRNGLEPKKRAVVRSVFEYGGAMLLWNYMQEILGEIKKFFPDSWREIVALSITRTLRPVPIKYAESAWSRLYLSEEIDASLSPGTIASKLREIGSDWASQRDFFSKLIRHGSVLFLDLSSIFSESVNLRLAEKGYNKDHLQLKQVNFALLFADGPVMLKTLPGSMRDVKYFSSVVDEFNLTSCTIVTDRGFLSMDAMLRMKEKGINFVQPLRRNSKLIDYSLPMDSMFVYHHRGIRWGKKAVNSMFLYLFEDVKLKGEEQSNLIEMAVNGNNVKVEEKMLGKISVLSSIDTDGEKIYLLYKQREDVDQAFDAMKNELENDKSYLSDDYALRGYFFISFISLYLYYSALSSLRNAGLVGEVSVNELLFNLSRVFFIKYSDGRTGLSEIPKKVEEIVRKIEIGILPKK